MTETSWIWELEKHLPEGYYSKVNNFLNQVYTEDGAARVFPKRKYVFRAFEETPLNKVKVVILGQDPYHGEGQAQGLAFSVEDDVPAPPSLKNILKELEADIGKRASHDLMDWANQGVLLLNACLTVEEGKANSHQGLIWESLTDAVMKVLNNQEQRIVFILWGGFAQKKKKYITNPQHIILESPHPSPLSSYRGFFGSQPFSKANSFLEEVGMQKIDWTRS